MCAIAGTENQLTVSEQAAYIQGWKEFLQSDAGCFLRAAAEAQRAVDYLRGALSHGESGKMGGTIVRDPPRVPLCH